MEKWSARCSGPQTLRFWSAWMVAPLRLLVAIASGNSGCLLSSQQLVSRKRTCGVCRARLQEIIGAGEDRECGDERLGAAVGVRLRVLGLEVARSGRLLPERRCAAAGGVLALEDAEDGPVEVGCQPYARASLSMGFYDNERARGVTDRCSWPRTGACWARTSMPIAAA